MNYLESLDRLPKSWLIVGGVVLVGVVGWSYLRGSSGDSGGVQVIDNTVKYDMDLIQLGTEAGLARDRMATDLALNAQSGKTSLDMATIESNTALGLAGLQFQLDNNQLNSDAGYNLAALASNERSYALGQATTTHLANLDYNINNREIDLATGEQAQKYNLANYQTMVQHDLGKKGIKAEQFANVTNAALGAFKIFKGG